jgi:hypothetical protein
MTFMLGHTQIKAGGEYFQQFNAASSELVPTQEAKPGWKLVHRLHCQSGPVGQMWHLWEMSDITQLDSGRAAMRGAGALAEIAKRASECTTHEEVRIVEEVGG